MTPEKRLVCLKSAVETLATELYDEFSKSDKSAVNMRIFTAVCIWELVVFVGFVNSEAQHASDSDDI